MADNVAPLPGRGQTYLTGPGRTPGTTGQSNKLEGIRKEFSDRDSTAVGPNVLRSQKRVTMALVRNVSGAVLASKATVSWATGQRNKRVGGYCSVDFAEVAGVVDEFIGSAGVPNNDLFWLAVKGPALIRKSLAADATCLIPEGTVITALTANGTTATTAGRIQPFIPTSVVTQAISSVLNRVGRAISASTTSQTGGSATPNILVDLEIMSQA
jgi:hypothetical protein